MMTQSRKPFSFLVLWLVLTTLSAAAPAPAALHTPPTMPDELMSAVLTASAQPFTATADGYQAHSGGLDVYLRDNGLRVHADGIAWSLSLRGWGHGEQVLALAQPEIVQIEGRLEFRRGAVTEWYRDTALGVEQGFTLSQPLQGAGALVLQFELSTAFSGTVDADGRGLSLSALDGQTLRYDHLRAWDANGTALDAHLEYALGRLTLEVNDLGAAYPITIDPLIYRENKLTASDGAVGDYLGYSVALSGGTALVGAAFDDTIISPQGAAYVFTGGGRTWKQQARLVPADRAPDDQFGSSVAVSGDTALVGAPGDDVGPNANQGSAYVFVRTGATWTQQAKLTAPDGAADDQFGWSVALLGDTAFVGARMDDVGSNPDQGSVYVFTRSGTAWGFRLKLTVSDGGAGDEFGYSVALSGNTALVGAAYDNLGAGFGQGSAYIFIASGSNWTQQAHLTAWDGAANDAFGFSVSLSGDTALIGAAHDVVDANTNQGSAYVFTRSGTAWAFQKKLTASDGATEDYFGFSVALSGDMALVGAHGHSVGSVFDQGSAYIFTRSGTIWNQEQELTASDGGTSDGYGYSVALSSDTALVGSPYDRIGGNVMQGSAYIYDPKLNDVYLPMMIRSTP